MSDRFSAYAPQVLAALRVVAALLFIAHGTQKLLGFPTTEMQPPLMSLFGAAGIIEIVAGLMILVGFFTRPVAFVLCGFMAVAYFMGHVSTGGFFPSINMGGGAILYCFIFGYLVLAGPGAWSVNKQ